MLCYMELACKSFVKFHLRNYISVSSIKHHRIIFSGKKTVRLQRSSDRRRVSHRTVLLNINIKGYEGSLCTWPLTGHLKTIIIIITITMSIDYFKFNKFMMFSKLVSN